MSYIEIVFDGGIKQETDAAIRIKYDGHDQWIPKSVIEDSDMLGDDISSIYVKEWFVEKEELV